jgi:hypothetical protein
MTAVTLHRTDPATTTANAHRQFGRRTRGVTRSTMRPLVLQNSRMLLRTSWSEPPRYEYSRSVSVCSCSGRPPAKLVSRHGGEEKRRPNAASSSSMARLASAAVSFRHRARWPSCRPGVGRPRRASCRVRSVAERDGMEPAAVEAAGHPSGSPAHLQDHLAQSSSNWVRSSTEAPGQMTKGRAQEERSGAISGSIREEKNPGVRQRVWAHRSSPP